MEYFDVSKCELINPCKPCSFKELQKWEECQETGFRLIKQCRSTAHGTVNEQEEVGSSTMACFLKTPELDDRMQKAYGEAFPIPDGLLGDTSKMPT